MRSSGSYKQFSLLLTLLLSLVLAYSVSAATYYVSPSGSDANLGTQASPWATIGRGDALNRLQPGDTVLVQSGTYRPAGLNGVYLGGCSGTATNPITYKAEGTVVIDQSNISGVSYGFMIKVNGIVLDGFEITNCQYGIHLGDYNHDFTVTNCIIHDMHLGAPDNPGFGAVGIFNSLCTNTVIHNNVIYDLGDPASSMPSYCVFVPSAQNISIYNNTLVHAKIGVEVWSLTAYSPANTTIKNNIISNMWGYGLESFKESSAGSSVISHSHNLFYGNASDSDSNILVGIGEFNADPEFVSPASHNYRLSPGSQAIDKGINLGLPYNGVAPDLGAYETTLAMEKADIAGLKSLADGSYVVLTSQKVVTAGSATFSDGGYYIEEPTRISGIKVIPPANAQAVVPGNRIGVTGTLDTDTNGERVIRASSIDSLSSGPQIGALAMKNSVAVSSGRPDASGLLVRVFGWATSKAIDGSYVYIDDSSSSKDATGNTGVRVMLTGLGTALSKTIVPDQYVVVTGIAGSMRDGNNVIRVIRPRGDADITVSSTLSDGTSVAQRWIDSNFGPRSARKPFSFTYDGLPSTSLLPLWQFNSTSQTPDADRTQRTFTYSDPTTGLEVKCIETQYSDYPAVEWVVYFKNNGSADTPILENVQALNSDFWGGSTAGDLLLHYSRGCNTVVNDYEPQMATLGIGSSISLGCEGGRSSSRLMLPPETDPAKSVGVMPFFNLEKPDGSGIILAVGWSGQWDATFTRVADAVNVQAGMELTHLKLHPGEEIRTPASLLLFWTGGDRVNGQNNFRRLLFDHYSPTPGGVPVNLPVPASPHGVIGLMDTNETNMIQGINNVADNHLPVDTWWIDAGWYTTWPMDGVAPWNVTGTWEPDPVRYPHGMKPVADAAHARGLKLLLWFEVERAVAGSWLAVNHPEWLLHHGTLPPDLSYEDQFMLVDFGNPAALAWAKDKFSRMIHDVGIDIYRIDFNMDPLYFWRYNEPSDRQGINEIKYIMGWYDYLDTLLRENPNLMIDSCAGGGRRLDFEMLRRASAMTRDDLGAPIPAQCQTYGLSQWVPMTGGIASTVDYYNSRSAWGSSFGMIFDWYNTPGIWTPSTQMINQYRSLKSFFTADFYPISGYSTGSDAWIAWQYDRPEIGEGLVQAFRRSDSTVGTTIYKLRALSPLSTYIITNLDTYTTTVATGNQLMQSGLMVSLPAANGSAAIKYRRLN